MIKAILWSCRVLESLFHTFQQFSRSAIWSHWGCLVNSNYAHCNWKWMPQSKKSSSSFTFTLTILRSGFDTPNHYNSWFFIFTSLNLPLWSKIIKQQIQSQILQEYFLLNLMFQYWDVSGDTSLPMHRRLWTDLSLFCPSYELTRCQSVSPETI